MMHRVQKDSSMTKDDLYSAGMTGLRRGVLRYDPARGTRFSTVGCIWILQALQASSMHRW